MSISLSFFNFILFHKMIYTFTFLISIRRILSVHFFSLVLFLMSFIINKPPTIIKIPPAPINTKEIFFHITAGRNSPPTITKSAPIIKSNIPFAILHSRDVLQITLNTIAAICSTAIISFKKFTTLLLLSLAQFSLFIRICRCNNCCHACNICFNCICPCQITNRTMPPIC